MMTKTMATLAALALTSVFTATGASASATGAGPDPGTDPVIGAWTWSSFTDWQTDPNPPADPDGQAGEDNLLNVTQIGERYEQEVEGSGTTETTDWVLESPGDGWVTVDQRTVVDAEAWEETVVDKEAWTETIPAVPGFWTNFQPNDKHGTYTGPPSYPTDPDGSWSEPKTNGGPDPEASGVYQNGKGNGSWFYRSQGSPEQRIEHPAETHVVTHDAVTHEEFRFELTTHGTVTEYRWSVYTRVNTPGTPPVDTPPSGTPPSDTPPSVNPPTVSPAASVPPSVSTPPKATTPAAPAVPVSIDAGL